MDNGNININGNNGEDHGDDPDVTEHHANYGMNDNPQYTWTRAQWGVRRTYMDHRLSQLEDSRCTKYCHRWGNLDEQ